MIPTLGRRKKHSSTIAPLLSNKRKRAERYPTPKLTTWQFSMKPKVWDIGPGPWFWMGKKASRPEYITLIVLRKLGWTNVRFQTDILGGRRLPGGQVLDIIIEDAPQPVYISVKGYYHEGAKAVYEDRLKEIIAQAMIGAKVLEVWEKDIDQPGWLEAYLRRELGTRGR